jgi:hypothetical protein
MGLACSPTAQTSRSLSLIRRSLARNASMSSPFFSGKIVHYESRNLHFSWISKRLPSPARRHRPDFLLAHVPRREGIAVEDPNVFSRSADRLFPPPSLSHIEDDLPFRGLVGVRGFQCPGNFEFPVGAWQLLALGLKFAPQRRPRSLRSQAQRGG